MAHEGTDMEFEDAAVRWFGRLRLNTPSALEKATFERWRADPAHAAAFERAERAWQDLGSLEALPEARAMLEEAMRVANAPRVGKGAAWKIALAASVLLAAVLLLPRIMGGEKYETQTAEVRALSLADGSRITLGPHSKIFVAFTASERRLRLTGGEAFFEVHKDPARPFVVDAGDALVRVLGTKFDVRRGEEQVTVAVLEGSVEVMRGSGKERPPSRFQLNAGQQIAAGRAAVSVNPRPISRNAPPGAWRSGRLSYDSARLVEVIADVNRYYPAGVELTSDDLADLKVTTAFSVDQIDLMINSLTLALPVTAVREPGGRVLLRPVSR